MSDHLAPNLPPDKDYHVYLVHSDNEKEVTWVRDTLLKPLEKYGFRCVFKDRDFKEGGLELKVIEEYFKKSWKFIFVVSPGYLELVQFGLSAFENAIIVGECSNERTNVVCLVLKQCHMPSTISIFERIDVKRDSRWFKKLLHKLGAKVPTNSRESSFRHCSMCDTDFPQDVRQFQCFMCKKVGCSNCCKYMAPVPPNFMRQEQVCHDCFNQEQRHYRGHGTGVFAEGEPEAVSDPNADRFGFIIFLHFGYGGSYKQINSTKSTPKYCDMCKRTDRDGMALAQCRICYEIGCRACISYCAPLTSRQIAMGAACFGCFQQRHASRNTLLGTSPAVRVGC